MESAEHQRWKADTRVASKEDHLQGKTANFLRGMMEAMTMAENNRIVYLVKLSFKGKDEMKLR